MSLTAEDKQWVTELLVGRLEKLETRLLTEFHKFAEANDLRVRSHGQAIHALELEMNVLENRVRKIEERFPR